MNYWNKDEIPHKGWLNQGSEDLEEATHVCDMCGKEEIRYVHTMYHPCVDNYFKVGCVCAEKMTNDYVTPKQQLKKLMAKASWTNGKWKKTELFEYQEKNFNSKYGRVNVGVFKVDDKYRFHLDDFVYDNTFDTVKEAKDFIYTNYK